MEENLLPNHLQEGTTRPQIEPWTSVVRPSYQPTPLIVNLGEAERRYKTRRIEMRVLEAIAVVVLAGAILYQCNDPEGKPLEGFDQNAYIQNSYPR